MFLRTYAIPCLALLAAGLAGCGGGGSSSSAAPASTSAQIASAEGLYTGTTSTNRTVTGIILSDGTYYVLYSPQGSSSFIAGVVQGTGTTTGGSFASTDAKDFNLEGQGILSASVSSSFTAKSSFNGTVSYPALNQSVTFTTTYDTDYDTTPSLNAIAGTYAGQSAVVGGSENATVVLSSSGALSGSGNSGCTFSGQATPRAHGNAYDLTVTFGGSPCANANTTTKGIGYYRASTKRLYAAGLNSGRTNGFIYVGAKP